ncbi:MAG: GNAT family N-acetyltransferase [Verrucomicrobiota bacterium JB023]|nr:GNAT family N-acetyltransferase [Verrucomicrobiota bacterium JB023]
MREDIREVLQYVPLFAGRTFVVVFDEDLLPEPAVAETLLDLIALQRIGVRLVVVLVGGDIADLADWAVEMEFKAEVAKPLLGDPTCVEVCRGLLKRGQAALVSGMNGKVLGPEVGALAVGVCAAKLMVLVSEKASLPEGRTIPAMAVEEVTGNGLLGQAARICRSGVPRVHLLDGRMHGVLTAEIFSPEGVGTMVHADSYRAVRGMSEEDIPELLAMMGRSVRAAHLVPRSYEQVEERLGDFLLMTLDDSVIGCVAVHHYEGGQVGEVACLYVKLNHEGRGYGKELVEAAERKARKEGLHSVFALTNRAGALFSALGYVRDEKERLPAVRREQLEASGRGSEIWWKDLA